MRKLCTSLSLLLSLPVLVNAQGNEAAVPAEVVNPPAKPINKAKKKSTGATKHFTVIGDNIRLNKAVSALSDDLVRGVYKYLGEKVPKTGFYPTNLILYSKGNAKKGKVFTTSAIALANGGYSIRLVVDIREQIDRAVLEQGIMQAIVLERTMRTNPAVNADTIVSVPRWLSDGLLGALKWKDEKTARGMFVLLRDKPELFTVKDLFNVTTKSYSDMGSTKKDLYMASSTALVLALQRQAEGKQNLSRMLGEIGVFEGEQAEILRKHFATVNVGTKGLQKLWGLQLADMSVPKLVETMSILETDKKLTAALFFHLRAKGRVLKKIPLENYAVLQGLAAEERVRVANMMRQDLVQMSYRSYPDYQPLIAEYGHILTDIAKGEFLGVDVRLKNLADERVLRVKAGERVRNVVDWYQISQARDLKGDFTGYEKLIDQMEKERKRDADKVISPYLDTIEQLMKK